MNAQQSAAERLPVSETLSFAHRTPDGVRVVVHVPGSGPDGSSQLRLRRGDKTVRVDAVTRTVDGGTEVEATVPKGQLGPGVWTLAVGGGTEGFQRLQSVLLTGKGRPIALLPGPRPRTKMPEPQPRPVAPDAAPAPVRRNPVRRVLGRVRRAVLRRS